MQPYKSFSGFYLFNLQFHMRLGDVQGRTTEESQNMSQNTSVYLVPLLSQLKRSFICITFLIATTGHLMLECNAQTYDLSGQHKNTLPKVDNTRTHAGIPDSVFAGLTFKIESGLLQNPEVYIPSHRMKSRKFDLLIHFHGQSYAVKYAAREFNASMAAVSINLGESAAVYAEAFKDTSRFKELLKRTVNTIEKKLKRPIQIRRIFLSAFDEGYGAVRQIVSVKSNLPKLYGVLLLDGIHAKYIPDRKTPEGIGLDSTELQTFVNLASQAANPDSKIKFLVTHSEIFPGTFASSTECSDYIIWQIGVKRNPTLRHGPLGMQQLSRARLNHFEILGFAGNTLRDHLDHLEALYHFLRAIVRL